MDDIAVKEKPAETQASAQMKAAQSYPIPLADRRRLNASYETVEPQKPAIRDWASI